MAKDIADKISVPEYESYPDAKTQEKKRIQMAPK